MRYCCKQWLSEKNWKKHRKDFHPQSNCSTTNSGITTINAQAQNLSSTEREPRKRQRIDNDYCIDPTNTAHIPTCDNSDSNKDDSSSDDESSISRDGSSSDDANSNEEDDSGDDEDSSEEDDSSDDEDIDDTDFEILSRRRSITTTKKPGDGIHVSMSLPTNSEISFATEKGLELITLLNEMNISYRSANDIIEWINKYLGDPRFSPEYGRLPSQFQAKQLLRKILPVQTESFHVCRKGCVMFPDDSSSCCTDPNCKLPRYKDESTKSPVAETTQLPLASQLAVQLVLTPEKDLIISDDSVTKDKDVFDRDSDLSSEENTVSNEHGNEDDPENEVRIMRGIHDGNALKRIRESMTDHDTDVTDIYVSLFSDGFSPFKRGGPAMTLIMAAILNLPSDQRYKKENLLLIGITPGPKKPYDLLSYLKPTIDDLLILESEGLTIEIQGNSNLSKYRVHLVLAGGDIPGVAEYIHHSGHCSYFGCRVCVVRGEHEPGATNGIYYPPSNPPPALRVKSHFENGDPEQGLKDSTPFASLQSFHGPTFFPLDEMHLLCHNLSKQIWEMISGEYGENTPFFLQKKYRDQIGNVMKLSKLPYGFDGKLFDIQTKKGHARAVDWMMFLLYVLPSHVIDMLDQQQKDRPKKEKLTEKLHDDAKAAIGSLVYAVSLALRYEITESDIIEIEQCISLEWHPFLLANMPLKVFTANQHYLTHLTLMIRELGPPRFYSTRPMERMNGEMKRRIKSRSRPAKNAENALVDVATTNVFLKTDLTRNFEQSQAKTTKYLIHNAGRSTEVRLLRPDDKKKLGAFTTDYNLEKYLKDYYRRRKLLDKGEELEPSIVVGDQVEFSSNMFTSIQRRDRTSMPTYFAMLSIPIDQNAKNKKKIKDRNWGEYFATALLFFFHTHRGKQRALCLIALARNVKKSKEGAVSAIMYNGLGDRKQHRHYVIDAKYLDTPVGFFKSISSTGTTITDDNEGATKKGYLVWPGMAVKNNSRIMLNNTSL